LGFGFGSVQFGSLGFLGWVCCQLFPLLFLVTLVVVAIVVVRLICAHESEN